MDAIARIYKQNMDSKKKHTPNFGGLQVIKSACKIDSLKPNVSVERRLHDVPDGHNAEWVHATDTLYLQTQTLVN